MASQSNSVFTVNTDNKYVVEIREIKNIEEATDDFMTYDEVIELMGLEDGNHIYGGVQLRNELITTELALLKQQIIDSKKKTILIRDTDLVEALQKQCYAVSDFVDGLRRVGNRLFLHTPPVDKQTKKQNDSAFSNFMWRVQSTFNKANKIEIDIKYTNRDRHAALDLAKKLFEKFDDVNMADIDPVLVDLARDMWDNIDKYFERKTEEVVEETKE